MELNKRFKRLINKKNKAYNSIRKKFNNHPIIRFLSVILILFFYFLFVLRSHSVKDSVLISLASWSFFVLCTPIADGGVLIDFPMKLITGIKMVYSEIFVWITAISLNIFLNIYNPEIYSQTIFLSFFKHILNNPFPYWIIIIISLVGTFLSLYVTDNIIDSNKTKKHYSNFLMKHRMLIISAIVILILFVYEFLLNIMNLNVPLF